jgi:hypothetical protein
VKPVDAGAKAAWDSGIFGADISVLVDSTGAGAFVDLTNWFGENWVSGLTIEESVDEQSAGATLRLKRRIDARDLSPYVQSSLLNIVTGSYVPALAPNREIKILAYVGSSDMDKNSMVPVVSFHGRIDAVDAAADNGKTIELVCRDGACDYQTQWIEASTQYSSGGGVNIASVMQSIINGWVASTQAINTRTLYVPVAATFTVLPYVQEKSSVMDALRRLADMIGWDLRWKWNNSAARFELTFIQPDRSGSVPATWTYTVNNKYTVNRLASDRTNVRNRVRVVYTDSTTQVVTQVLVTDSVSIAKYGPAYMEMVEDSASEIDTNAEATAMANAILSDVMEPLAEYELDSPYNPWVELNDRITLQSAIEDLDVADVSMTLAATTITHTIKDGSFRTVIGLRGAPSSGFQKWLRMSAAPGVGAAWQDRTMGTPTTVLAVQTNGGIDVTFDMPTEPDWAISRVYVSTSSGFTPDNTNLAAEGRTNKFKIGSLTPGVTYYVKIIHFNRDGARSSTSSQVVVAANYVGPAYVNLANEPGQLVPNCDFNVWTPPATLAAGPPDNWRAFIHNGYPWTLDASKWNSGAAPAVYAIAGSQTGSWVIRVKSSGTLNAAGLENTIPIPVTPNTIYEIEAAAKSISGGTTFRGFGVWYEGDQTTQAGNLGFSGTISTSEYTKQTVRTKSPATAQFVRLAFSADLLGTSEMNVDYIKIRRAKAGFEVNAVNTGTTGQILGTAVLPLVFTNVGYDYGSDVTLGNATTGTYFLAPEAGQYSFEGVVTMTGTSTGAAAVVDLQTSPDGSTWTFMRSGSVVVQVNAGQVGCPIACSLTLAKGTYVRLVISKGDAGNSTLSNSASRGYLKGWRVDGGGGA